MSLAVLKEYLRDRLTQALVDLGLTADTITIEASRSAEFGDLSTNIALTIAKIAGRPPLGLAKEINSKLNISSEYCDAVTVSEPGFINFFISGDYLRAQIPEILMAGDRFGQTGAGKGKRALVEFVSANPTGPLTVGHGRQAVLGDVVSSILEWNGYNVTREYYFNDAGRQMRLLGESVYARYMEELSGVGKLPEGGYEGEYIKDIAEVIVHEHGDSLKDCPTSPVFKETAEKLIFDDIKQTLEKIGLRFNNFVNEKTFYEDGTIDRVVEVLRNKDYAYNKDGAVWFRTSKLGKDQDTVLIKQTGEPTYRLPDIAYHTDKLNRGFDFIVDIFGADHKDTYPDVLAALEALGYNTESICVLIHQFVSLKESGKRVKMSTRKATFVTLEELIDQVGADVVRYFFVMRNMHSHLNFDLALAKKESDENPVYYLQYAHARICNIIKYAKDTANLSETDSNLALLTEPSEMNLLKEVIRFPEVIKTALDTLEPHGIASYLQSLSSHFHKFYTEYRVVTEDRNLSQARLALVSAVKIALANGLHILGISTPERM